MSHLNAKNELQEWCQKNSHPLPEYETKLVNLGQNQPLFESTVTLFDGTKGTSISGPKKVNAEMDAADFVLNLKGISKQNIMNRAITDCHRLLLRYFPTETDPRRIQDSDLMPYRKSIIMAAILLRDASE